MTRDAGLVQGAWKANEVHHRLVKTEVRWSSLTVYGYERRE